MTILRNNKHQPVAEELKWRGLLIIDNQEYRFESIEVKKASDLIGDGQLADEWKDNEAIRIKFNGIYLANMGKPGYITHEAPSMRLYLAAYQEQPLDFRLVEGTQRALNLFVKSPGT